MEKPLSVSLRLLLLSAGGLAVVAGPILFLFPYGTSTYFAWTIKHPLTPVFMGANYLGGLGAIWSLRDNRWSLARVQMPGIIVFAVSQLLATALHTSIFNWSHPIAWAWLFVYATSPVATIALFVLTERGYQAPAPTGAPLPGTFTPLMRACGVASTLVGLALFLAPGLVAPVWAWSLTPLTARVIGGWYLAGAALQFMLAGQRTWQTAKVGVVSSLLVTVLQLAGAALHLSEFNGSVVGIVAYLVFSTLLASVSAYAWLAARSAAVAPAQVAR